MAEFATILACVGEKAWWCEFCQIEVLLCRKASANTGFRSRVFFSN